MFFFLFFFFFIDFCGVRFFTTSDRDDIFTISKRRRELHLEFYLCLLPFFFFNFTADGSFFFFCLFSRFGACCSDMGCPYHFCFSQSSASFFFFFAFRAIHLSLNVLCFYLERGKGGEGWVASLIYLQHKICDCARMGCCSALWGSPSF